MAEHHKRCPKDMDPMWGQCACDVIDGLLADLRAKANKIDKTYGPFGSQPHMLRWQADILALFEGE